MNAGIYLNLEKLLLLVNMDTILFVNKVKLQIPYTTDCYSHL